MDLVVFGANGPTGRQVVLLALAAGHHVPAVTRKPDEFPVAHSELTVVTADVTDADAVARALAGQRAVISTYGVPYSRKPITVYSQGMENITRAMADRGVAPHRLRGRFASRADLAQALVAEATEPRHSRSIVEIITRSELPSPLANVLKEAFGVDPARLTRRASSSS